MKRQTPHTKLSNHEFIMLRSLTKTSWLSVDPVLWRRQIGWYRTPEARVAAESLLRRGLVDCEQLMGFSPVRPREPVKHYWINARGTALLNKANGVQLTAPICPVVAPQCSEKSRLPGRVWWRIVRSFRRRLAVVDATHQSNIHPR